MMWLDRFYIRGDLTEMERLEFDMPRDDSASIPSLEVDEWGRYSIPEHHASGRCLYGGVVRDTDQENDRAMWIRRDFATFIGSAGVRDLFR